jgi:hypothetical protein
MKRFLYFILINLFVINTYGQKGYYSTDSITFSGIDLVDGSIKMNQRFCQIKKGEEILKYSPYEVKEYGFQNGLTYKSFEIKLNDQVTRYFLERVIEGKINLYLLRTEGGVKYYMETDRSGLEELPAINDEYRDLLAIRVSDSPEALHNIPFVRLKKHNLIRLIKDYNNDYIRLFPRIQYGFTIGITSDKLSAVDKESLYSIPDYKSDLSISAGAFIDLPVNASNFSFHPEVYYKRNGTSKAFDQGNTSHDLVINYSCINIPLLFRYSILKDKLSPYFQGGPVYSRIIKNESALYEYRSVDNNIYIDVINSPVLQKNRGGFSVGSGVISNYESKYSWFAELRYSKFYNLKQENKLINHSEFSLGIGLLF